MLKTPIYKELEKILQSYVGARTSETFAAHKLRETFDNIKVRLSESNAVQSRPRVHVKWSMGQGNWAKVPWIAFLDDRETDTTQDGIYCVYLFCQDMSGVYLTFNQGVTRLIREKGKSVAYATLRKRARALRESCHELESRGFMLGEGIDLKADPGLGADYEPSTIAHKLYEAGQVPNDEELLADVESVLRVYDQYLENRTTEPERQDVEPPKKGPQQEKKIASDLVLNFLRDTAAPEAGLRVTDASALRFFASVLSKRFLILAGLAGSGKTKIAQAAACWITPATDRALSTDKETPEIPKQCYLLIPVGADWTGNESIVGYPNGLDGETYMTKPALELIRHALEPANAKVPHFLILDEMNLSHVERYFADVLSAIESEEEIPLYEGTARKAGGLEVPRKLRVPENLFIIGTVNVDETTYMFSPKVLDRANVIEFRMEPSDLEAFLAAPNAPSLVALDGKGAAFGKDFVEASADKSRSVPDSVKASFEKEMLLFFNLLREHNAEFGYRTGYEAARFVHFYNLLGGFPDTDTSWFDSAMDAVIVQKFLPKLHGSRSKLEGLLWALAWACGAEREDRDGKDFVAQLREASEAQDEAKYGPEVVWASLKARNAGEPAKEAPYPLSLAKVMRMWRKLVRDQFASFAEA